MLLEECIHGDLFDYISTNGAIKDQKLLKYMFLQICSGVTAVHTVAQKAHLDLKLENILIGSDEQLKICDFGMAAPINADLVKRQGTETYIAPEIENKRSDETYKGQQADIFSLGVLLWIMHFARPPFTSSSNNDRMYPLLQRKPEIFWKLHPTVKKLTVPVDQDFKNLMESMLNRDLNVRPQIIEEVLVHPYFTKEEGLLDSLTNQWDEGCLENLKSGFREHLSK